MHPFLDKCFPNGDFQFNGKANSNERSAFRQKLDRVVKAGDGLRTNPTILPTDDELDELIQFTGNTVYNKYKEIFTPAGYKQFALFYLEALEIIRRVSVAKGDEENLEDADNIQDQINFLQGNLKKGDLISKGIVTLQELNNRPRFSFSPVVNNAPAAVTPAAANSSSSSVASASSSSPLYLNVGEVIALVPQTWENWTGEVVNVLNQIASSQTPAMNDVWLKTTKDLYDGIAGSIQTTETLATREKLLNLIQTKYNGNDKVGVDTYCKEEFIKIRQQQSALSSSSPNGAVNGHSAPAQPRRVGARIRVASVSTPNLASGDVQQSPASSLVNGDAQQSPVSSSANGDSQQSPASTPSPRPLVDRKDNNISPVQLSLSKAQRNNFNNALQSGSAEKIQQQMEEIGLRGLGKNTIILHEDGFSETTGQFIQDSLSHLPEGTNDGLKGTIIAAVDEKYNDDVHWSNLWTYQLSLEGQRIAGKTPQEPLKNRGSSSNWKPITISIDQLNTVNESLRSETNYETVKKILEDTKIRGAGDKDIFVDGQQRKLSELIQRWQRIIVQANPDSLYFDVIKEITDPKYHPSSPSADYEWNKLWEPIRIAQEKTIRMKSSLRNSQESSSSTHVATSSVDTVETKRTDAQATNTVEDAGSATFGKEGDELLRDIENLDLLEEDVELPKGNDESSPVQRNDSVSSALDVDSAEDIVNSLDLIGSDDLEVPEERNRPVPTDSSDNPLRQKRILRDRLKDFIDRIVNVQNKNWYLTPYEDKVSQFFKDLDETDFSLMSNMTIKYVNEATEVETTANDKDSYFALLQTVFEDQMLHNAALAVDEYLLTYENEEQKEQKRKEVIAAAMEENSEMGLSTFVNDTSVTSGESSSMASEPNVVDKSFVTRFTWADEQDEDSEAIDTPMMSCVSVLLDQSKLENQSHLQKTRHEQSSEPRKVLPADNSGLEDSFGNVSLQASTSSASESDISFDNPGGKGSSSSRDSDRNEKADPRRTTTLAALVNEVDNNRRELAARQQQLARQQIDNQQQLEDDANLQELQEVLGIGTSKAASGSAQVQEAQASGPSISPSSAPQTGHDNKGILVGRARPGAENPADRMGNAPRVFDWDDDRGEELTKGDDAESSQAGAASGSAQVQEAQAPVPSISPSSAEPAKTEDPVLQASAEDEEKNNDNDTSSLIIAQREIDSLASLIQDPNSKAEDIKAELERLSIPSENGEPKHIERNLAVDGQPVVNLGDSQYGPATTSDLMTKLSLLTNKPLLQAAIAQSAVKDEAYADAWQYAVYQDKVNELVGRIWKEDVSPDQIQEFLERNLDIKLDDRRSVTLDKTLKSSLKVRDKEVNTTSELFTAIMAEYNRKTAATLPSITNLDLGGPSDEVPAIDTEKEEGEVQASSHDQPEAPKNARSLRPATPPPQEKTVDVPQEHIITLINAIKDYKTAVGKKNWFQALQNIGIAKYTIEKRMKLKNKVDYDLKSSRSVPGATQGAKTVAQLLYQVTQIKDKKGRPILTNDENDKSFRTAILNAASTRSDEVWAEAANVIHEKQKPSPSKKRSSSVPEGESSSNPWKSFKKAVGNVVGSKSSSSSSSSGSENPSPTGSGGSPSSSSPDVSPPKSANTSPVRFSKNEIDNAREQLFSNVKAAETLINNSITATETQLTNAEKTTDRGAAQLALEGIKDNNPVGKDNLNEPLKNYLKRIESLEEKYGQHLNLTSQEKKKIAALKEYAETGPELARQNMRDALAILEPIARGQKRQTSSPARQETPAPAGNEKGKERVPDSEDRPLDADEDTKDETLDEEVEETELQAEKEASQNSDYQAQIEGFNNRIGKVAESAASRAEKADAIVAKYKESNESDKDSAENEFLREGVYLRCAAAKDIEGIRNLREEIAKSPEVVQAEVDNTRLTEAESSLETNIEKISEQETQILGRFSKQARELLDDAEEVYRKASQSENGMTKAECNTWWENEFKPKNERVAKRGQQILSIYNGLKTPEEITNAISSCAQAQQAVARTGALFAAAEQAAKQAAVERAAAKTDVPETVNDQETSKKTSSRRRKTRTLANVNSNEVVHTSDQSAASAAQPSSSVSAEAAEPEVSKEHAPEHPLVEDAVEGSSHLDGLPNEDRKDEESEDSNSESEKDSDSESEDDSELEEKGPTLEQIQKAVSELSQDAETYISKLDNKEITQEEFEEWFHEYVDEEDYDEDDDQEGYLTHYHFISDKIEKLENEEEGNRLQTILDKTYEKLANRIYQAIERDAEKLLADTKAASANSHSRDKAVYDELDDRHSVLGERVDMFDVEDDDDEYVIDGLKQAQEYLDQVLNILWPEKEEEEFGSSASASKATEPPAAAPSSSSTSTAAPATAEPAAAPSSSNTSTAVPATAEPAAAPSSSNTSTAVPATAEPAAASSSSSTAAPATQASQTADAEEAARLNGRIADLTQQLIRIHANVKTISADYQQSMLAANHVDNHGSPGTRMAAEAEDNLLGKSLALKKDAEACQREVEQLKQEIARCPENVKSLVNQQELTTLETKCGEGVNYFNQNEAGILRKFCAETKKQSDSAAVEMPKCDARTFDNYSRSFTGPCYLLRQRKEKLKGIYLHQELAIPAKLTEAEGYLNNVQDIINHTKTRVFPRKPAAPAPASSSGNGVLLTSEAPAATLDPLASMQHPAGARQQPQGEQEQNGPPPIPPRREQEQNGAPPAVPPRRDGNRGKGRAVEDAAPSTFQLWLNEFEKQLNNGAWRYNYSLEDLEGYSRWLTDEYNERENQESKARIQQVGRLLDQKIDELRGRMTPSREEQQSRAQIRIFMDGTGKEWRWPRDFPKDGTYSIPTSVTDRHGVHVEYGLIVKNGKLDEVLLYEGYELTEQEVLQYSAEAKSALRQLTTGKANTLLITGENPQYVAAAGITTRAQGDKIAPESAPAAKAVDGRDAAQGGTRKSVEEKTAQAGKPKISQSTERLDTYGKSQDTPYPVNGSNKQKYHWAKANLTFFGGISSVSAAREMKHVKDDMQNQNLRDAHLEPVKPNAPTHGRGRGSQG